MREYATDAARKAEELKTTHERTKELEGQTNAFAAIKEDLTQALEFEKSLVESLERDLAAAKAAPAVTPAELEALVAALAETERRAAAELEAHKAQAAAQIEAVLGVAKEDIETLRLVTQSELDDVRAQTRQDLEAAKDQGAAEAQMLRAQLEAARASAALEVDVARHELAARRAELELASSAEREALASHVTTVHSRFEALVVYARALESRLVSAEARRGELEVKLEELVDVVRSHALSGEIPPPMELPNAPIGAPTSTD